MSRSSFSVPHGEQAARSRGYTASDQSEHYARCEYACAILQSGRIVRADNTYTKAFHARADRYIIPLHNNSRFLPVREVTNRRERISAVVSRSDGNCEREERAKWGEAIFNWSRSRSEGSDDIMRQLTSGVGRNRELLVSLLAMKVMYVLFYYNIMDEKKRRAALFRGAVDARKVCSHVSQDWPFHEHAQFKIIPAPFPQVLFDLKIVERGLYQYTMVSSGPLAEQTDSC